MYNYVCVFGGTLVCMYSSTCTCVCGHWCVCVIEYRGCRCGYVCGFVWLYVCAGFVSNGEYNVFRSKGYTRPLSVFQLRSQARKKFVRMSKTTMLSMLTPRGNNCLYVCYTYIYWCDTWVLCRVCWWEDSSWLSKWHCSSIHTTRHSRMDCSWCNFWWHNWTAKTKDCPQWVCAQSMDSRLELYLFSTVHAHMYKYSFFYRC